MAITAPTNSTARSGVRTPAGRGWLSTPSVGHLVALVVATGILLALHLGPALPGLKPQAQTTLGVFLWFIILLATEAVPQISWGWVRRCSWSCSTGPLWMRPSTPSTATYSSLS